MDSNGEKVADLEREFQEALFASYRECKDDLGYNATYLLQLLHGRGGSGAARKLLADSKDHHGLTELHLEERLDLSVECNVLKKRFQPLFTPQELETARRRLRARGFDPAECET